MHDGHSIRGRQNDGGAAEGNTLRIDILQHPVINGWCDAERYLQLLLAKSLPTGTHSWTDPAGFEAEAQPPKRLV
jgi:hypothetical protein